MIEDFASRLRREVQLRYHDRHPFHRAMHEGALTRPQLQGWVANRFYYQTRIPIKDALILAKSEDPAFRRIWIRRIVDHDGAAEGDGGLELWLRLAEGVGLERGEVRSFERVLPTVRAACDAYVDLVSTRPLVEAVAASLTELFAPDLMRSRIAAWQRHYPWVDDETLTYFRDRVPRAKRDGEEALAFVSSSVMRDRALQDDCVEAVRTKCQILWALLDGVAAHYGIGAA